MSEVVGPGTELSGRYRVLEQGTSDVPGVSVWHATDQILDRPVRAVVLSTGDVSSALDGARRAALVSDPRLARVLDVGMHGNVGYVVTEDVSGPTLADLLADGPLTADQARAVIGEAAAALEVARRRGLHHLALRPRAVRVVGPGRVLLTGLGIDATIAGAAGGDARTTSRRDSVDLVRLLYTALTGRWPASSSDAIAPGVPSAPATGGVAVPPAELVATVPNDLDTLCTVTLGPHDDGPHTPGDLVRELEPWGAIRTEGAPPAADASEVAETAVIREPTPEDDMQDTAPIRVQRQSVREVFGEAGSAVNRPGTPPPAAPLRTSAFGSPAVAPPVGSMPTRIPARQAGAAAVGAAGATAVGGAGLGGAATPPTATTPISGPTAAAPPSIPPGGGAGGPAQPAAGASGQPSGAPDVTQPTMPVLPATLPPAGSAAAWSAPAGDDGGSDDFGAVIGEVGDEPPTRRSFDPTALVLTVVGIAVVVGVVLAFKALFSSLDTGTPEPRPVATSTQESTSGATGTPSDDESTEPTQDATTPVSTAPPVIKSASSVDPSDDDGEHEEAVARAFDGDTSTYWYTMTYQQPNFSGFKEGVGFVMLLEERALVSTVTLKTNSSGGHVEVRTSGSDDPGGGTLLASGEFGPEVTLELDPATELDRITLWITELPTAADGSFRLELTEVELG